MITIDKVRAAFEAARTASSTEAIFLALLLSDMSYAHKQGEPVELVFHQFKLDANKLLDSAMKYHDSFMYTQALSNLRTLNQLESACA